MLIRALQMNQCRLWVGIPIILVGLGALCHFNLIQISNKADDLPISQVAVSSAKDAYQAGIQSYRKGEYRQASEFMRQVLEQQPAAVNAHYYLAVCQDLLGNRQDALPHYQWVANGLAEAGVKNYAKERLEVLRPEFPAINPGNVSMAGVSQSVPSVVAYQKGRLGIVPLKHSKNALMVEATLVNAKTGKRVQGTFILDTGATYTSISEEMAQNLGLDTSGSEKVRITTANGRIDVSKVVIDKIQMEGVEAQQVPATIIHVRPDSSFSGLLGLSFIRQFKMTIDPVANQLVFEAQ